MLKFLTRKQSIKTHKAEKPEPMVTIQANIAQIQRLAQLGAITPAEAEAGSNAGGLLVKVPARLVAEFQMAQKTAPETEITALAKRIDEAGLSSATKLLLTGGRPVSFVSSQVLLMLQPVAQVSFGAGETLGKYSRLLENRSNLDELVGQLDVLEANRAMHKTVHKEFQ